MAIIKNGSVCETEERFVEDDQSVPADGTIVVSAERWLTECAALRARGDVGIRLASSFAVESLDGELQGVSLILVDFPVFSDGRGYSIGRLLRDRLGFEGELRAIGDVLPDQLSYMARCGFDAFALKPGKKVESALAAMKHLSVKYQPATDQLTAHWRLPWASQE